jgi:drug/metabolite transporter (DMT)-like permease
VIAFGTYLTLLGRIGPDRAAYVTILFQIVALALSTIFEDLIWNLQGVFGVILILAGNVIALSKISIGTK